MLKYNNVEPSQWLQIYWH